MMRARRRLLLAITALALIFVGAAGSAPSPGALALAPLTVEVTTAGDSVAAGESLCPHATKCTLRRAIELVNADASGLAYAITFKPSVFPVAVPALVAVVGTPLPVVTRADVTVDASLAGVRIDGSLLSGTPNGLVLAGDRAAVRGLAIHNFRGACLAVRGESAVVGGDPAQRQGNTLGNCGTGLAVSGAISSVTGNTVGFTVQGPDVATVSTGILVTARGVALGNATGGGNVVGNATGPAIQVGDGTGPAFTGVFVTNNTLGRNPGNGDPAPIGVGVDIRQPSSGTQVQTNLIASAATGIRVAPDQAGVPTTGNRLTANRFEGLTGMAIDLKGDGMRNVNDEGDGDTGPNAMLNHPVISRATQSRIQGTAGSGCAGCSVQLYTAAHAPGSPNDYGSKPLAGGVLTADASGSFALDNPAVVPGQWVTALAIDANGNTSEFGPSVRVGAGVVQCGNLTLQRGWNHAGFFGPDTVSLGMSFPSDGGPSSKVAAIYHLEDGAGTYAQWLADATGLRSLDSLLVGEAYWYFNAEPVVLSGGFSLNVPLPVQLRVGWNDFVYVGASADVRDALGSITGKYRDVYRWTNDGQAGQWSTFGRVDTPDWAREFTEMQACGVYAVFVTEDATLTPLQP